MRFLIVLIIITLSIIQEAKGQEILYQRPEKNVSLIVASNSTHTYRLNISNYAISVSKFDEEMAFEDIIVVYPEDEFFFTEGKHRMDLTSFGGFQEMVISSNFLHLLFEAPSHKKAKYYLFDLKINLETFEAISELELIHTIKSKRKADLLQTSGFDIPYISYSDSLIKALYQKPNKFKDDFYFGFLKIKIADKLSVQEESEIALMPGIKRDFFKATDIYVDVDDNIICVGEKIAQDKYTDKLTMFFFRDKDQQKFEKLNTNLDHREMVDYEMFIEEGTPVVFGLCEKTKAPSSKKSKKLIAKSSDDDQSNLESFAMIFQKQNYQFPKVEYYDNLKKDYDGKSYYRILRNVTAVDSEFYLVFQYLNKTEDKNISTSYYKTYKTYVRDFEVHKLNENLSPEWTSTIPYKAIYNLSQQSSFTRCNLIFKDNDEIIVLYNDAYANAKKNLDDDLNTLDLSYKENDKKKLSYDRGVRNQKITPIEEKEKEAYTISFVSLNRENGEIQKIDYNQRKLFSLVFNGSIKGYRNAKTLYIPYFFEGMFGICSIDKSRL